MRRTKLASLSWSDGRYLDLWSIVHFLSGVIAGPLLWLARFSFWPGLLAIMIVAIIYEYGEKIFGISEDWGNILIDIILAMTGYSLYTKIFAMQNNAFHWGVLLSVGAANVILSYIGYLNFRKREKEW